MGLDFIADAPLLLSHCGFVFVSLCLCNLFLVGSRVFFVSGCSAVSCDFGIFVKSEFTSFYSVLSLSCNFNYLQTPGVTQGRTAVQWWSQDSNPGSWL